MSWDAGLYVRGCLDYEPGDGCDHPCGHHRGDWNYTHNTNRMIHTALDSVGVVLPASTRPCRWYDSQTGQWHDAPNGHGTISWWDHLDGMSGAEGHFFLRSIIDALAADPGRSRAMNPENGWGDYDSLLGVLAEMRDACAVEDPNLVWWASG